MSEANLSKPRRPRSLMVLGTRIAIRYRKNLVCEDGEPMDGMFVPTTLTIYINSERPNINQTLLHELTHAAIYLSGAHNLMSIKVEEAVTSAIEAGLKDYFRF